ncbi:hypothetical protein AOQ84DRAFT_225542 [Glonium stellatum]|uniref:Uncharacterized protein n=1 Tax=Glonium stellatum TaxID=574774 RepID=A0A8E2JPK0_9PEZI|nr:hypothetical protein AOQ84DRAFT_225542 [Glonium stellatum]
MFSSTLCAVLATTVAFSVSVQAQNLRTSISWGSNSVFIGDISATRLTSSPWLPCGENNCDPTNPSIVNGVGYVTNSGWAEHDYETGSISVVAAGTYNNYDERNAMLAAINVVLSSPATCQTTTHTWECFRRDDVCFHSASVQACSIPEYIEVVIEHEGGGAPSSMSITSTFTGEASPFGFLCGPLASAVEAGIGSVLGPFGGILGVITGASC